MVSSRPGRRGPALSFPGVFCGLPAAILVAVPGGGAGSSGPTGNHLTYLVRHFSVTLSLLTRPTSTSPGQSGFLSLIT